MAQNTISSRWCGSTSPAAPGPWGHEPWPGPPASTWTRPQNLPGKDETFRNGTRCRVAQAQDDDTEDARSDATTGNMPSNLHNASGKDVGGIGFPEAPEESDEESDDGGHWFDITTAIQVAARGRGARVNALLADVLHELKPKAK